MAIQMRRGNYADYDESKIRPGEWAVATDTERVFIGMASGAVEMAKKSDVDSIIETATDAISEATDNALANLTEAKVDALAAVYGDYPSTVSTAAEMTDTNAIYIYSGSETGYVSGNWYYYDGSAWVSGGAFVDHSKTNAPIIYNTASGAVASFSDGADDYPIKSLTVAVEPVQAGSGDPYPSGGSINKMPAPTDETKTASGITIKAVNGVYTITGTNTSSVRIGFYVGNGDINPATYKIAFMSNVADANISVYFKRGTTSVHFWTLNPANRVVSGWTATADETFDTLEFFISAGTHNITVSPMIIDKDATVPSSFVPYSNIRPISGFSEVNVTMCGKNILPFFNIAGTYADITVTSDADKQTYIVSGTSSAYRGVLAQSTFVVKAGTYTLSRKASSSAISEIGLRMELCSPNGTTTYMSSTTMGSTPRTYTFSEDTEVKARLIVQGAELNFGTGVDFQFQLELGSAATDYEPYQGNTYTISLGETVYGGTLDVVGGKMVVDRAMIDLGYKDWATLGSSYQYGTFWTVSALDNAKYASTAPLWMCDRYKAVATNAGTSATGDNYIWIRSSGGNKIAIKDTSKSSMSASEFKAAMSGVQFVYMLRSPIEISLTPTQINTLLGVNNVYSDAGDVSVEYPADTKTFILNAIASALA